MTNDIDERLLDCFQAALPKVPREKLRTAAIQTTTDWDSMVTITLLSLIEESFGIQAEAEDIEHFTSFSAISEYLRDAHHRVQSRAI